MEFMVCLNSIEDVLCLIQMLERYEYDADASVEDNVINARSLMGLVALGIGKQLRVMIHNKVDENRRIEIMQCFCYENPNLSYTVNGNEITITADAYAKSIEILNDNEDLILSDNYFDMNAGTKTVKVESGEITKLRIRSVYDIR